jgi:putative ABC transport system permease protein
VLKGSIQMGRWASLPRKVLVVVQFTCSIALIISTVIVYQQIQYVKNRPTGYSADRLMMTDMNSGLSQPIRSAEKRPAGFGTGGERSLVNVAGHTGVQPFCAGKWPGKNAGEEM